MGRCSEPRSGSWPAAQRWREAPTLGRRMERESNREAVASVPNIFPIPLDVMFP